LTALEDLIEEKENEIEEQNESVGTDEDEFQTPIILAGEKVSFEI